MAMNSTTSTSHAKGTVDIDQDVKDMKNQLPALPSRLPTPHKDFLDCVPPNAPTYRKFSVFTAGSIEMGNAAQWQKHMTALLSHLPITVCNPRRGHWNPDITLLARDEDFRTQVEWELAALEQVDVICFFFDVMTKSPVSLLELGLWSGSGKVVVCCGEEYWKGGNVELTCHRYDIPFVKSFAELVPAVEKMLVEKGMVLDDKGDLAGQNVHVEKEKPKKRAQLEAENAGLQKQIDELQAQLAKSRV
ncbi:nucleoside 2-deoxyribosyltransferase domain-containing [Pyrenophora seminiperda CCB06]|uniref:Nucleoside 2-deoxyribosyltransferase domain-containing n=1 Tax=Pyrenophora seminiperda CCB06 TaxID=1302712 RepID=A0A3M7LVY7_9PLEO|nr:nucleoside 2-deoxyribosyltransferase domain-containing [Pyrenophora seminiperda CCB06]